MATQQLDLAWVDCDRALKIQPNDANIFVLRGNIRLAKESFEDAVQDYSRARKAIEIKPDAAEDYFKRGLIRVAANDRAGATEDMKKASELYVQQGRTDSYKNVMATMKQLDL